MRIAVATPTGRVGRHVTAMLVRAGVRPLALVRDPARLPGPLRPEVDVAQLDLYDASAVVRATAGADALYWVVPGLGDHARAAEVVVAAVTRNRISRVVFQSSVGAELRAGAGEIDGLAANEVALETTRANLTHLRCGFFFSNLLPHAGAGHAAVTVPVDHEMPWVAPRDVAEVAVGRLLNTSWYGRHVQAVHGPADLSWQRAARIVTEVTGRPFTVERVGDDAMRGILTSAGLSGAQAEAVLGMSTGLRDGFVPEQPRSVRTTTPTTLRAWAADALPRTH